MGLDADFNFEPKGNHRCVSYDTSGARQIWRDLPEAFSRGASTLLTRYRELQAISLPLYQHTPAQIVLPNVSVSAGPMLRVPAFVNHHTGSTLPIAHCARVTDGVLDV